MRAFLASLVLLVAAAPGSGADYTKIDRTLQKEPAYTSKAPKYALLLFGRDALLSIWVVLDGDTLYFDRNGDGDLTAASERFEKCSDCKDIELTDPDGKTRYVVTSVAVYPIGKPPRPYLDVNVDVKGPLSYRQYCGLEVRNDPKKASLAHFHGPLTVGPRTINWKLPPELALAAGDDPTELHAVVGTMSAEFGCWVVVRSHVGMEEGAFPKGVAPVVDVEFPPKTPGDPPVKRRYALDHFC